MTRRWRRAALLLCSALASCIVKPRDPFVFAERASERGDLLTALQEYDAVPVTHVRYPEARAAAVEIETRVRRCHELILEALVLRGEWRDAEALEALRRARQQWPQQPSLERWIVATEQRCKLFASREQVVAQVGGEAAAAPAGEPGAVGVPSTLASGRAVEDARALQYTMPGDVVPLPASRPTTKLAAPETGRAPSPAVSAGAATPSVVVIGASPAGESRPPEPVRAPSPPAPPEVKRATRVTVGEDPVALSLISVEGRLGRGEFRQAVDDLIELARRCPTDLRVCQRLVPLLKQRALLSYGDGAVSAAIVDWRRVLELQPDDLAVRGLIDRALGEAGNR